MVHDVTSHTPRPPPANCGTARYGKIDGEDMRKKVYVATALSKRTSQMDIFVRVSRKPLNVD